MIRRKGQVFRLETPNTTLAIKADTAEYLYYGKKLVSGGGFEPFFGSPRKIFSQYGGGDYTGYSVLLGNADGGMGTAFLEVDGSRVEKTLAPGEVLRVDTGNVVAFEGTVSYEIETVRGGMNIFLGGEGLFLTRLVGPGRVILQTQNFAEFCGRIRPYMPTGGNN